MISRPNELDLKKLLILSLIWTEMLINQGIDADSARRIATMDRLPGITDGHSKHGFQNGVSKDTFSSKLGMDIARWPEYHFKGKMYCVF